MKKFKLAVHRSLNIFHLCLLLHNSEMCLACNLTLTLLSLTEVFLIKSTQALLLKFFILFSQQKRNHSYPTKRVSDSLDISHYKLLAPLWVSTQITFLISFFHLVKMDYFIISLEPLLFTEIRSVYEQFLP